MDRKQYMREWHQKNREKQREYKRAHYEANKDEYIARAKKRRLDDPDRRKVEANKWRRSEKGQVQSRRWYAENSEAHGMRTKDWKERNHGKVKEYTRARQAGLQTATPAWADRGAIQAIYEACPEDKWVDHVVPLNGDTVCGLHVDYNLQYLTPRENMAKGNKLI